MLQHLLAPQVIMAFTRLLAGNSIMLNLLSSPKHVQLGQRSVVVAAAAGGGANKSSRRRRSSSLIDQQELKDVFLDTSQQLQPVSSRRRRKLAAVQQGQAPKQQLHPQEVFNTWQQQEPQPQQQPQQQGNLDQLLENTQQLGAMQASQVSSDTTTSAAAAGSLDASSDTISSTFLHSSGSGQPNSSRQEAASSRHDNHQHAHAITAAAAYRQQQASSSNVRSIDQHSDEDSDTNSSASYEGGWDFVYRISDEVQAAISRITRFLDFRERCASEVLTKLYSLGYSRDLSREVLFALQKADIQSDKRFAEVYVRGQWRTKAQSPTRLAYELRSRGVAREHIDAALALVFGDTKQLPAWEPGNDAEEEAWEHLVEVCRRKVEFTQGETAQKRRAKLAGWMQRRGHNMSTVFRIFDAVGI